MPFGSDLSPIHFFLCFLRYRGLSLLLSLAIVFGCSLMTYMQFLFTFSFDFWSDPLPYLLKPFHAVVALIDFHFNEAGLSRFVVYCPCLFHKALSTKGSHDAGIWSFCLWRRQSTFLSLLTAE
jgi:hypothetical protein